MKGKLIVGLLAVAVVIGLYGLAPVVPPPAGSEAPETVGSAPEAQRRRQPKFTPLPPLPVEQRFNGKAAYQHLLDICEIGSRTSGSPGMLRQQEMLSEYFTALGAEVSLQKFETKRHPGTGELVPMANLIVQWRPEAKERVLFCAHYDTRPLPDRDPDPWQRQNGVFLGANDGASGVALLMEFAHRLPELKNLGIDFVMFDGEEFIFDDNRDEYFLGSRWFAEQYRKNPPPYRYQYGVLVDMVADARLNIEQERHSMSWAGTRPLVLEIWETAKQLRVREFVHQVGEFPIRDDHLPLNQIARIPVCDVIDFEYPNRRNGYWHTTADNPENCSAESIGKVGWVLQEWLRSKTL